MALSRRAFFSSLLPIQNRDQRSGADSNLSKEVEPVLLGRLSDFPVGTEKKIKLGEEIYSVGSCSIGIKACKESGAGFCALSMNKGLIYIWPDSSWPDNAFLSAITGEVYFVEGEIYG